jgi:hypothetical protein
MKKSAYLAGPFIGELEWEFYRFAPYLINLKKNNPENKLIVYTRPTRFDLYGSYADVLVPLNLKGEEALVKKNFGIVRFDDDKYNILIKHFFKKYKNRYKIVDHIYPDNKAWRNKVKWQFPREEMNYDFKPRKRNYDVIDGFFDTGSSVFICTEDGDTRRSLYYRGYEPIMLRWVTDIVETYNDGLQFSFLGCLIILLKRCKFVVGNMRSSIVRLALLLKIPVISINEKMEYDSIGLLNPFKTPVINAFNIDEGVDIYEDNI